MDTCTRGLKRLRRRIRRKLYQPTNQPMDLDLSPSSIEVSDWLNLSHVMPSNDRPVASQSDVAEILSKRLRFKCDLPKGARSLKM